MVIGPVMLFGSHDESRSVYEQTLRGAGLRVVAATCDDAFEVSTHARPSVIVVVFDTNNRAECLALCERLKVDDRTRTVPVILASTKIDDVDIRNATDARVLALALPAFDGMKLLSVVRGVLIVAEGRAPMLPSEQKVSRSA